MYPPIIHLSMGEAFGKLEPYAYRAMAANFLLEKLEGYMGVYWGSQFIKPIQLLTNSKVFEKISLRELEMITVFPSIYRAKTFRTENRQPKNSTQNGFITFCY